MKKTGIYWLVANPETLHQERSALLEELDYQVSFYHDLESLQQSLQVKRVSIIIVDESLELNATKLAMNALASMPDIQGARLLFSAIDGNDDLCFQAGCHGFRDIIPLDLEPAKWLERFQFSTASHDELAELSYQDSINPTTQITIGVPSRVVWVQRDRVWVESKARPELSDTVELSGSFPSSLGSSALSLAVKSRHTSDLAYRFSEASTCEWYPDKDVQKDKMDIVFKQLEEQNPGEKKKVFLAIQSPALRTAITRYLDPDIFDVHSALQKKSLVSEPKYFSPSLVIIEYRLCAGESMVRFQEMIAQTPETSVVILVGAKKQEAESLMSFCKGRKVEAIYEIPKNFSEFIQNKYLQPSPEHHDRRIHIPKNHDFSFAPN